MIFAHAVPAKNTKNAAVRDLTGEAPVPTPATLRTFRNAHPVRTACAVYPPITAVALNGLWAAIYKRDI